MAAPLQPGAADLAKALNDYLLAHPRAAVLEAGRLLFDMPSSRFSLSAEHGRCVLHLWSGERNIVRTVTGISQRKQNLRLEIRRLGADRAQSMEVIPDRETGTPAAHAARRKAFARVIERTLGRCFPEWKLDDLRTAMDLEHSFGPAYVRGVLTRGQQAWAVIATGEGETQATIDGALTAGILWLAHCRIQRGRRAVFHGLKVIVPRSSEATTRARMAWLDRSLAQWKLYGISAAEESLTELDATTEGNLEMRLVRAFDQQAALDRAAKGIEMLIGFIPAGLRDSIAIGAKSSSHVALSLYGLEFAHVRQDFAANSFRREDVVSFGTGSHEVLLSAANEAEFRKMTRELFAQRYDGGDTRDPFFRLQPEKWLEHLLSTSGEALAELDASLGTNAIYAQVPAFAGGDRGMLDLLTANCDGRLAVLELKASEDLHLPLQGLDYWIRVRSLHQAGVGGSSAGAAYELARSGYFPGIELQPDPPLLYYVVPALHVHPSMETILKHLSKSIPWSLVAINEGWRSGPKAVFRKRSESFPSQHLAKPS